MRTEVLLDQIIKSKTNNAKNQLIYKDDKANGKNEFLFFIKPEILIYDPKIQIKKIIDMFLTKLNEFNCVISSVRILPAQYLKDHNIIADHYGVINKIASDSKGPAVSQSAKEVFKKIFNEDYDRANTLGGVEFLKKHPGYNAESLNDLWQKNNYQKLAGGTYATKVNADGEQVYLINGFHPLQLEHFTKPERFIVVFSLKSDTSWENARKKLIGSTNPQEAESGSIRKNLLDNCHKYGLKAVTPSLNGVHLSAGPVEALIELIRFQSDFDSKVKLSPSDFQFGKELEANDFTEKDIQWILKNPIIESKNVCIFDLTEEKDSDQAIRLLKEII